MSPLSILGICIKMTNELTLRIQTFVGTWPTFVLVLTYIASFSLLWFVGFLYMLAMSKFWHLTLATHVTMQRIAQVAFLAAGAVNIVGGSLPNFFNIILTETLIGTTVVFVTLTWNGCLVISFNIFSTFPSPFPWHKIVLDSTTNPHALPASMMKDTSHLCAIISFFEHSIWIQTSFSIYT